MDNINVADVANECVMKKFIEDYLPNLECWYNLFKSVVEKKSVNLEGRSLKDYHAELMTIAAK